MMVLLVLITVISYLVVIGCYVDNDEYNNTNRDKLKNYPFHYYLVRKFGIQFDDGEFHSENQTYKLFKEMTFFGKLLFIMSYKEVLSAIYYDRKINVMKCIFSFLVTLAWYTPVFLIEIFFEIFFRMFEDNETKVFNVDNNMIRKSDNTSIFEKLYK